MPATDMYPIATRDGVQIRLDLVRPEAIHSLSYGATTGSAVLTAPFVQDAIYELLSTTDTSIDFTAVASKTPVGANGMLLKAGIVRTVILPSAAIGFSAVGLVTAGTLFITRITSWAGMANTSALDNL